MRLIKIFEKFYKRSKDFETFLHIHTDIKPHMIKNLPCHEGEKELFLVGGELSYNKIISIINSNIHNYNNYNTEIDKLMLRGGVKIFYFKHRFYKFL